MARHFTNIAIAALISSTLFIGWLFIKPLIVKQKQQVVITQPKMLSTQKESAVNVNAFKRSLQQFNPWESRSSQGASNQENTFQQAQESNLNIRLVGTLVFSPQEMWAIVEQGGQQKIIKPNDKVQSATVEKVDRKALFLRNRGRLEVIKMSKPELLKDAMINEEQEGAMPQPLDEIPMPDIDNIPQDEEENRG